MFALVLHSVALPAAPVHTVDALTAWQRQPAVSSLSDTCFGTVSYSDYENTMTMTATVSLDGTLLSSGTLGAFVGDTIRGKVDALAAPPIPGGPPAFFMPSISGSVNGETLTYKLCVNGVTYTSPTVSDSGAESFTSNANLGSIFTPVAISFTTPPPSPSPSTSSCSSWSVATSDYENTMTMTATVSLDGTLLSSGTLGAFVGDTIRGKVDALAAPPIPGGPPAFFMPSISGSVNGETITYTLCVDDVTYTSPTVSDSGAESFTSNANLGSIFAPVAFAF